MDVKWKPQSADDILSDIRDFFYKHSATKISFKKEQPQSILELVIFLLENGHAKGLTEALEMLGIKED